MIPSENNSLVQFVHDLFRSWHRQLPEEGNVIQPLVLHGGAKIILLLGDYDLRGNIRVHPVWLGLERGNHSPLKRQRRR